MPYYRSLGATECEVPAGMRVPDQVCWRGDAHVAGWVAARKHGLPSYWVTGSAYDYSLDGRKYRKKRSKTWLPLAPVSDPSKRTGLVSGLLAQAFGKKGVPAPPPTRAAPAPALPTAPRGPWAGGVTYAPTPIPTTRVGLPLPLIIGGLAASALGLIWLMRRKR